MGVRISWDIWARNLDFAFPAFTAVCAASTSFSFASSCQLIKRLIILATATMEAISMARNTNVMSNIVPYTLHQFWITTTVNPEFSLFSTQQETNCPS